MRRNTEARVLQILRDESIRTPTGCWLWTRAVDKDGYGGGLIFEGKLYKPHRLSFLLTFGSLDDGPLDHVCHTNDASCLGGSDCVHRRCVNPAHLESVTHRENCGRSAPARKNECKNGHPYDSANTYIRPNGQRDCRACVRDRVYRYKTRRSA